MAIQAAMQAAMQVQAAELKAQAADLKYQALAMQMKEAAHAADMARVIRGERPPLFPLAHELAVQKTVLQACALSLT